MKNDHKPGSVTLHHQAHSHDIAHQYQNHQDPQGIRLGHKPYHTFAIQDVQIDIGHQKITINMRRNKAELGHLQHLLSNRIIVQWVG